MFTLEEKKQLRKYYWNRFKAYSNGRKLKAGKSGKWIMDQTGIKQLKLKFHFDETQAWAGIEIDTQNLDKRIDLFDKMEKLRSILSGAVPYELNWELEVAINPKKNVSRIFALLPNVNIYNTNDWMRTNEFLYNVMAPIEDVYTEYIDFIKYQ